MKRSFVSPLKSDLAAFLGYKRALGLRYARQEETLRQFDRYVCRVHPHCSHRSDFRALIQGWLAQGQGRKPGSVALEWKLIRQFCLFRRRRDPGGFVPDRECFPRRAKSDFIPHIFSLKEIHRLLRHIARAPGSALQRLSGRLLLLALYCTGLRFGEAARLQLADLDLNRRLLWIRESKGRTRLVPFGPDLAREFRSFLSCRRLSRLSAQDPLLLSFQGKPLSGGLISRTLRGWLRKTDLKTSQGRVGPRPYDVRHTFAVHRLSRWYRRGLAVCGRLPWLSIYMGHANILGTETYLTTTPEVQGLVSRRFEALFRKCRTKR